MILNGEEDETPRIFFQQNLYRRIEWHSRPIGQINVTTLILFLLVIHPWLVLNVFSQDIARTLHTSNEESVCVRYTNYMLKENKTIDQLLVRG